MCSHQERNLHPAYTAWKNYSKSYAFILKKLFKFVEFLIFLTYFVVKIKDPSKIGQSVQDMNERLSLIEKAASAGTPGDGINLFNVHKANVFTYISTEKVVFAHAEQIFFEIPTCRHGRAAASRHWLATCLPRGRDGK